MNRIHLVIAGLVVSFSCFSEVECSAGSLQKAKHWAFDPPVRPDPPSVGNASWVRNPIDHFILSRLEKEGLQPAPQAERSQLIRRVSLDLIGLPPGLDQLDAFLEDKGEGAYTKLVEKLLQSAHYGEKWGRHWLDAARYSDSDGFEKDKSREVWFYRDWVIQAFNRDLPYDQFIIQQLAGDLLPGAGQEEHVATGFLRNSMINEEGGIDPEQFRMEAMFDRMDAIGKSILGLTIQCAQCHDHKYDPMSQEDYYKIFSFLNNDHEALLAVYTPAEHQVRAGVFQRINELEQDLKHRNPDWEKELKSWMHANRGNQPEWIVLRPHVDEISTGGQKYQNLEDGSFLAEGYAPTKHTVMMTVKTDIRNITGFRLELLMHANLPAKGPGRSIKGTGALTEFEVDVAPAVSPDQKIKIKFSGATSDINLPDRPLDPIYDDRSGRRRSTGPVSYALDGNGDTAWGIDSNPATRNQARKAVFVVEQAIESEADILLTFRINQAHGGWNSDDNQNQNLGRFRISVTTSVNPEADPLPKVLRDALESQRDDSGALDMPAFFSYWRTTVKEWKAVNDEINALLKTHPEGTTQLVLSPMKGMRDTRVLKRGSFLTPDQSVVGGVPGFLHDLPEDAPLNRLTFARWLVDRKSPTTARAIVNRVWQSYFGIGLVETSEDLGTQSPQPSHPELLDWLAVEFMEHGWSFKKLHRLIVHSSTYRQSSMMTSGLVARDPANRLFARGPRFRVDGEIVRDIALAVSGLLDPTIGGPSVYPPAPGFLYLPPVSYGPKNWNDDKREGRYRRGLYTFAYRSVPYPMLQTFDVPNGDFSCVRRERSNTPLQALVMLNEPVLMECARAFAAHVIRVGGGDRTDRIHYAYRRCLSRLPTAEEVVEVSRLLDEQKQRISDGWLSARDLIGAEKLSETNLPPGSTPTQLAAWTVVSRVLLNLDETITKE